MSEPPVLFTLGHSDRTLEEFLECLSSFGVEVLVDARSWPTSRHHPHFSRENLEPAVVAAGYRYRYLGRELGGHRTAGYEAHMETELFEEGLARLEAFAKEGAVAVMCAERDPSTCHRRHIAAAMQGKGYVIRHIVEPGSVLLPGERPEDQGTLFDL